LTLSFLSVARRYTFSRAEDLRERLADRDHLPFLGAEIAEGPIRFRFEIEIHLVGLDLQHRLALRDLVARLFVPANDLPLGHRIADLRHDDLRHSRTSLSSRHR
jgi:hypothetical protein